MQPTVLQRNLQQLCNQTFALNSGEPCCDLCRTFANDVEVTSLPLSLTNFTPHMIPNLWLIPYFHLLTVLPTLSAPELPKSHRNLQHFVSDSFSHRDFGCGRPPLLSWLLLSICWPWRDRFSSLPASPCQQELEAPTCSWNPEKILLRLLTVHVLEFFRSCFGYGNILESINELLWMVARSGSRFIGGVLCVCVYIDIYIFFFHRIYTYIHDIYVYIAHYFIGSQQCFNHPSCRISLLVSGPRWDALCATVDCDPCGRPSPGGRSGTTNYRWCSDGRTCWEPWRIGFCWLVHRGCYFV